jgi:hypothetical protein
MDPNQLERLLVTGVIRTIHAQGIKLADSAQQVLHAVVRERIAAFGQHTFLNHVGIDDVVATVARDVLGRSSPASVTSHKLIVRRRWIEKIAEYFDGIWPFSRPKP